MIQETKKSASYDEASKQCLLTVFTPAYNRAHTIGRTYESLCNQTCKDFVWLIIDDGSSDGTQVLVSEWIAENRLPICYIRQDNQGMHGAHNTAYDNITTELNTCIDSDDWMPFDAVESISNFWHENENDKLAGFIGLDQKENGEILGSKFPTNLSSTTLREYYELHNGSGDKKIVYRTSIIKNTPKYPIFPGERYVGLGYRCSIVDQHYKLLTLNKPLVIVDYQLDGSSMNMWRQYWKNPNGFLLIRKQDMELGLTKKKQFTAAIHFISHSIRANKNVFKNNPRPILTLFAIPLGIILFFVNKYKVSH